MERDAEVSQTQFRDTAESVEERNERLRRAGVSMPTLRDMAPFRAYPRRPRWLAFIIRIFRYFFPEREEANRPGDL